VTAGNSSGINDGAAALLVMTEAAAAGMKPLARIITTAVTGVDPSCMGLGPIPATEKALQRAGLTIDQIDLVELNEAFAAQAIACIRDLKLNPERVNIYGGAIALGHPLGCSGAKILTTLVYALRRQNGRYGLATMCIGVGQGIAMIVERL
jgi:acetyl-CoA acetyltransferase family protein